MRQTFLVILLLFPAVQALSVNVKGPDGYALLGFLLVLILPVILYFFIGWLQQSKKTRLIRQPLFRKRCLEITLDKDRRYFPDILILKVKNTGKSDIDIDRPMLVFRKWWISRKFRLKGSHHYSFYPLILEPGKIHELRIELTPFYNHDPRLKSYPGISVTIHDVKGQYRVSRSVRIRKTLFT